MEVIRGLYYKTLQIHKLRKMDSNKLLGFVIMISQLNWLEQTLAYFGIQTLQNVL